MPRKLTLEEVKEKAKERELILLDDKYINGSTKMTFMDNDGYKYYLTMNVISDKRNKKFDKVSVHNMYSIYNIQHLLDKTGYGTKIISKEFHGYKDNLEFICGCCGEKFTTKWDIINQTNKCTCTKCALKRSGESHLKDKEKIIKDINEMGYKLLGDYQNLHNINVEDKYGYKYNTSFYNLKDRTNKFKKFNKNNIFTFDNMKNYIKINNIPVKLVSKENEFIPHETSIRTHQFTFECNECHKEYKSTFYEVAKQRRYRCTDCAKKQSNIAKMVEDYLIFKNVNYKKEYRFDDCRNINPLPFDFYLVDYNYCIEVNGEQHYYDNQTFPQNLKERQRIDKIKENYCINNHIGYVAIPYWLIFNNNEKEAYKNIIDKILE